jgi:hypothetical protein
MKIKETMLFVGASYKTEILKITLINIAGISFVCLMLLVLNQIIFAILAILGLLVLNYFILSSYQDKKALLIKERENELITLISYFEIYIQNRQNVYQSFNMLIPFCSTWMKDKIAHLLNEIDLDKSVQPFINFANNFQQISASSLMLSIFQMVDQGENVNQLTQFHLVFDELAKSRNHQLMEQKDKHMTGMYVYPLIGAGLITITLTISILSILGDVINVL